MRFIWRNTVDSWKYDQTFKPGSADQNMKQDSVAALLISGFKCFQKHILVYFLPEKWEVFDNLSYFLTPMKLSESNKQINQCFLISDPQQTDLNSFLWTIKRDPPSYFYGTIHVPYTRVWDFIPENSKQAFQESNIVYFELDLTDPYTISALTSCQLLPQGENLQDVLPRDIYRRLKRHLSSPSKRSSCFFPLEHLKPEGNFIQVTQYLQKK